MKKRNIISFLTGTALLFSMPACTNLDETVYDNVPADSFGFMIFARVRQIISNFRNFIWSGFLPPCSRSDTYLL